MPMDLHTHNTLCHHATGEPVDYARVARAKGLTAVGMADHNPMPEQFDDWRMARSDLSRYLDLVGEARAAVAPFPVKLGLECDYLDNGGAWIDTLTAEADWDYLIGSVHYLAPGWDFDNPKHLSRFESGDVSEIWKLYWEIAARCVAVGQFDILGHADLVKKFGHRPQGDLRPYYEPVIELLANKNMAYELNTAGLRKPVKEMYPAREFIEMAFAAGVPVVISSDAHTPEEVGEGFDAAISLLREVGYTETATFTQRVRGAEALPPCV